MSTETGIIVLIYLTGALGLIWSIVCAFKVTSIDLNKPDRYHKIDLAHEEIEVT